MQAHGTNVMTDGTLTAASVERFLEILEEERRDLEVFLLFERVSDL